MAVTQYFSLHQHVKDSASLHSSLKPDQNKRKTRQPPTYSQYLRTEIKEWTGKCLRKPNNFRS